MRPLLAALLCILIAPASAAAAPALIPVRAYRLDASRALVTWQAVPGAALSCVTTYAGGRCVVGDAPGRLVVDAAQGEPVSLTVQAGAVIVAVGATNVGPPPVYLPAVEVSR